ncbi:DUF397 domain-containing protein [Actinomadura kijaniata]|uniref:DUF397 domain-containing protein n=1 Tax=Actinomadura kijaniata TaxID=46161 RepID=UPI000A06EC2B|nr:DUF397 domain-containing protein [Actinomadura kijaniata]
MDLSNITWRKASRSSEEGDNCVEVGAVSAIVAIRDSKNPNDGLLLISHEEARALSKRLKNA